MSVIDIRDHTELPYSRIGLTYVIKNLTIVLMSREVNVFKKRIHRPRALAPIDDR